MKNANSWLLRASERALKLPAVSRLRSELYVAYGRRCRREALKSVVVVVAAAVVVALFAPIRASISVVDRRKWLRRRAPRRLRGAGRRYRRPGRGRGAGRPAGRAPASVAAHLVAHPRTLSLVGRASGWQQQRWRRRDVVYRNRTRPYRVSSLRRLAATTRPQQGNRIRLAVYRDVAVLLPFLFHSIQYRRAVKSR